MTIDNLTFRIAPGQWQDYLTLAEHHYRAARPATVWRVWRLTCEWGTEQTGIGYRVSGIGEESPGRSRSPVTDTRSPLLWRLGGYPRLAGVAVVSYPVLQSAARNTASAQWH
jgi:hypothetical protein